MKQQRNDRTLHDYTLPGYLLHQTNLDRNYSRGMGIYVHSSISNTVDEIEVEVSFSESCFIDKKNLKNRDVLCFGCFYRSPTTTSESENNNLLSYICTRTKHAHLCLVGDFNFAKISWKNWRTYASEESKESKFTETLRDCFLFQHIKQQHDVPTNLQF